MTTLTEILLNDETRPVLINDCVNLINEEVASKSGLGGLAIKTAFKTVKAIKPGIIPDAVKYLLDDFVDKLEPVYAAYTASGSGNIKTYVVQTSDVVADNLLAITDERAEQSRHKGLVKAYKKLRPQGKKQVIAAMPRIGEMLAKHGL
ncbi:MAG: hypothetical protein VX589_06790 [Myxococcota bacterium]|nr:hypothetical protein [Myxococcota bacterium]